MVMMSNGMNVRQTTVGGMTIFKVRSTSGKTYTVQRNGDYLTCDCPHYVVRLAGTRKLCKHGRIAKMAAEKLSPAASRARSVVADVSPLPVVPLMDRLAFQWLNEPELIG